MNQDQGRSFLVLKAQLDEAIAQYRRAVASGVPVDREELLARHPDISNQLRSFFAAEDRPAAVDDAVDTETPPPHWRTPAIAAAVLGGVVFLLFIGMHVWSWATSRPLLKIEGHPGPVGSVAFSPDGKRIATASYGQPFVSRVYIGDPNDHRCVTRMSTDAYSDNLISVWNPATRRRVFGVDVEDAGTAYCVAYSPDGQWLATAGWRDEAPVRILDAATGQEAMTLRAEKKLADAGKTLSPAGAGYSLPNSRVSTFSIAFSSDSKRLAACGADGQVRVWDVETGKVSRKFHAHDSWVHSVAFSSNGKWLATNASATVKLWDAKTGKEVKTIRSGQGNWPTVNLTFHVTFSPDGKWLAATIPAEAWLDDGVTGNVVAFWRAATADDGVTYLRGNCMAFSPDGRRLAIADGEVVKLFAATTGSYELPSPQELRAIAAYSSVRSLFFSPDGKRLAAGCGDKTVKVWSVAE